MQITPSCIATFRLLHCDKITYIHYNDEAASKG
jgi:hypothetical protein